MQGVYLPFETCYFYYYYKLLHNQNCAPICYNVIDSLQNDDHPSLGI